jgi:hypothetical protein
MTLKEAIESGKPPRMRGGIEMTLDREITLLKSYFENQTSVTLHKNDIKDLWKAYDEFNSELTPLKLEWFKKGIIAMAKISDEEPKLLRINSMPNHKAKRRMARKLGG